MSIKQIEQEINRFLASTEPEVTCMTGRWGVGKTYAWNKYLQDAKAGSGIALKRYSYVSLFGINSMDDLKYAIFQNTVQSSEIGEPTLQTLQKNTMAAAEGLGRKFTWLLQQLPVVKNHVGGLGPVWFLSVQNTIICIDDIERRGTNLSIRDIMGLASHLKERKHCKLFFIMNDEAFTDDEDEFRTYYEKTVDTSLKFAPTAEECAHIAVSTADNYGKWLGESCVLLGISNIRLIKKVERAIHRIKPLLIDLDDELLKYVVKVLALFGWSFYAPDTAPPIEFLKGRISAYYGLDDKEVPPKEAAWNALLESYGFAEVDEFDMVLYDGLRNGFFEPNAVQSCVKELNNKITKNKDIHSFGQLWKVYHESFDDNTDEVIHTIHSGFRRYVKSLGVTDLNSTVLILKQLGQADLANDVIAAFVETHAANRAMFDVSNLHFLNANPDPDIVRVFSEHYASFKEERDLLGILLSLGDDWSPDDITILSTVPVEDYISFLSARGVPISITY